MYSLNDSFFCFFFFLNTFYSVRYSHILYWNLFALICFVSKLLKKCLHILWCEHFYLVFWCCLVFRYYGCRYTEWILCILFVWYVTSFICSVSYFFSSFFLFFSVFVFFFNCSFTSRVYLNSRALFHCHFRVIKIFLFSFSFSLFLSRSCLSKKM